MSYEQQFLMLLKTNNELCDERDRLRELVRDLEQELRWANDTAIKNGACGLTPDTGSLLARAREVVT